MQSGFFANHPDAQDDPSTFFAEALYDFNGTEAGSLSFQQGDRIEVVVTKETGWWDGILESGDRGWFPSNYVRTIDFDENQPFQQQQEQQKNNNFFHEKTNDHVQPTYKPPLSSSDVFSAINSANFPAFSSGKGESIFAELAANNNHQADDLDRDDDDFLDSFNTPNLASVNKSLQNQQQQQQEQEQHVSPPRSRANSNSNNNRSNPLLSPFLEMPLKSSSSEEMTPTLQSSPGFSSPTTNASYPSKSEQQRQSSNFLQQQQQQQSTWTDWIPKVDEKTGRIVYRNQRTGQLADEMPADDDPSRNDDTPYVPSSASPVAHISTYEGLRRTSSSAASPTTTSSFINPRDSLTAAFYNNLQNSVDSSEHPLPSPTSRVPSMDPRPSPTEWFPRKLENGKIVYQHITTGDIRSRRPSRQNSSFTSSDHPLTHSFQSSSSSRKGSDFDDSVLDSELSFSRKKSSSRRTNTTLNTSFSTVNTSTSTSPSSLPVATSSVATATSGISTLPPPPTTTPSSQLRKDSSVSETAHVAPSRRTNHHHHHNQSEVLESPPLPSLDDLEAKVHAAINELIEITHPQPQSRHLSVDSSQSSSASSDQVVDLENETHTLERDRLSRALVNILTQVSNVYHAVGILEQASPLQKKQQKLGESINSNNNNNNKASSRSSTSTALSTRSAINNDIGNLPSSHPLRSESKRVSSILSKVVLNVRGYWGCLPTSREEALSLNHHILRHREEVIERRKLDVATSARELADFFSYFLSSYHIEQQQNPPPQTTTSSSSSARSGLNIRVRNHLVASFKTSGSALLLPGGGSGGNWKGNGFATLPLDSNASNPLKIISGPVVNQVQHSIQILIQRCDKLLPLVNTKISSQRKRSILTKRCHSILSRLSHVMAAVEDIDIATGLDLDAGIIDSINTIVNNSPELSSHSPTNFINPGFDDGPHFPSNQVHDYQTSLKQARRTLSSFEVSKQKLYDLSAVLLDAVQSCLRIPQDHLVLPPEYTPNPSHPLSTYPDSNLSFFANNTPSQNNNLQHASAVRDALEDLLTGLESFASALFTLGQIADIQSNAPHELRRNSAIIRHSWKGGPPQQLFDSGGESSADEDRNFLSNYTINPHTSASTAALTPTLSSSTTNSQSTIITPPSHHGLYTPSRTIPTPNNLDRTNSQPTSQSSWSAGSSTAASSRLHRTKPSHDGDAIARSFSSPGKRPEMTEISPPSVTPATSLEDTKPTGTQEKWRKLLGDDAPDDLSSIKPRLQSPTSNSNGNSTFEADISPDDISYNVEGQIRGATLQALVAKLTSHEQSDSSFNTTFLMTYRTFTNSETLFNLLVDRYNYSFHPPPSLDMVQAEQWLQKKGKPIRIRVVNVFKHWIEQYVYNDDVDKLLIVVDNFAVKEVAANDPIQAQKLRKICEERRESGAPRRLTASSTTTETPPYPLLPKNPRKMKLLDLDPLEVARQLTILDSRLFCRIQPVECMAKAWPKEFGADAPNLKAMIDMNNAVTRWVSGSVLKHTDVKKRANTIKYFITVAERCRGLQNYSTLMQIVAGLNATCIHRLRRTWELVNAKTIASFETLKTLMSPTKNFSGYREAIRTLGPPCIPFMGVYLTDWTFIGDGNSDMLREKPHQINFNKRQKASEHIQQIQLYQTQPYNLAIVPSISQYIEDCLHNEKDEQELYEISLNLEPRERDDEKIARLLSESGFL